MSAMLDAALDYARRGRAVHPVAGDGSKRPLSATGFKDASIDEFRIREWWSRWPDAWIGTPTGDGWFVLDVDDRKALSELETERGFLPDTIQATTPRGGIHFYFKGSARTGNNVPTRGIDIRGYAGVPDRWGGFVIIPPSPGYQRRGGSEMLAPPPWLLELLTLREQQRSGPGRLPQFELGDIADGQRNVELARIAGVLLRRYVDVDLTAWLVHAANQTYFKPPKPRAEVDKVIDSVAGMELRRREAAS